MKILKFNELNESYQKTDNFITNEFGWKVPVYTYTDDVFDDVINIVETINGVSEKDYTTYDNLKEYMKNFFDNHNDLIEDIKIYESEEKRYQYCAEFIYDKYLKDNEKIKSICKRI